VIDPLRIDSRFGTLILTVGLVACGARSDLAPGDLENTGAAPLDDGADDPEEPTPQSIRCANPSFDYSVDPATVLLLVDRSGSMRFLFGSDSRWNVVRDALFRSQDGLLARLGDSARFGLAFYTSLEGFVGGSCPMMDYTSPVLGPGRSAPVVRRHVPSDRWRYAHG
jgi:hypothetical protein